MQRVTNKDIIKIISLMCIWFLVSILGAYKILQYRKDFEAKKIYYFNEADFFTLASLGLTDGRNYQNKPEWDKGQELTESEIRELKNLVNGLKKLIYEDYKDLPMVIRKKDKSYEIHPDNQIIDITSEVTKKLLGEKRWQKIGTNFLG